MGKIGENFRIDTRWIGEYQCLILQGRFVYGNTEQVVALLESKLENAKGYVVDAKGLERVDSTGLGVMVFLAREVHRRGASMAVYIPNGAVRDLFLIAKLDLIFPLTGSVEEAAEVLRSQFTPSITVADY
ncbi:STAS domain-containing protein [Heliophilum fasciatum]|uniref:Anti-anti-sigma factor n=1 Tax=Heliophilum fasciatum TaxID=35700 RepID=A0A4R2RAZ3_9FIRM|nr:STAS domain-containing protein [Heliophilum fasciatum]MCW2279270.1 anti-anti-sigma factor [Heliophilum fasciatum]TCP60482.1 anti-anti-sigma factor [Heliophilum fasciatum]